jgi:hypothetical protein
MFLENDAKERAYLDDYMIPLFERVFKIKIKGRYFNRKGIKNIYGFYVCSKRLVEILDSFGVACKHDNIRVPNAIMQNKKLWTSFLRGYLDNDGYLSFYTYYGRYNYYPRIGFTTVSKNLAEDVIFMIRNLGFDGSYWVSPIKGKARLAPHRFEIKGLKNLKRWVKVVGFSNVGKLTRYEIWKRFGFCPTNISLSERVKILNGEIDPNIYRPS